MDAAAAYKPNVGVPAQPVGSRAAMVRSTHRDFGLAHPRHSPFIRIRTGLRRLPLHPAGTRREFQMKRLIAVLLLTSATVYAQTSTDRFRFTTDYYFLDLKGGVGHREKIVGTYTRD